MFPTEFTRLEPRIRFAWTNRALGVILLDISITPLAVIRFSRRTIQAQPIWKANRQQCCGQKSCFPSSTGHPTRLSVHTADQRSIDDAPGNVRYAALHTSLNTDRTTVSRSLASQTLIIANGVSNVGRTMASAIVDLIGPVHILVMTVGLAMTAGLSGLLTFCLLMVKHTAESVVWSIAFGSVAGTFMGLPAAGVINVSNSTDNLEKRPGMILGVVGRGILVAEPIAGAILDA
jgi:hypothetical protein